MASAIGLLPEAAPLLARHLAAYIALATADAALLARSMATHLLAALLAALCLTLALLLSCLWIAAAAWDSPQRALVLATSIALFAIPGVVACVYALRCRSALASTVSSLRKEWLVDCDLIHELSGPSVAAAVTAVSDLSPQSRLQQSRIALRALMHDGDTRAADDRFPRSKTMRLLSLIPVATLTKMLLK